MCCADTGLGLGQSCRRLFEAHSFQEGEKPVIRAKDMIAVRLCE